MRHWSVAPALCALAFCACAAPPETPTDDLPSLKTGAAEVTSTADASTCCRLAAGTVIDLEVGEPLDSATQQRGNHFLLRVASPVLVDDRVVIPAGTSVVGEIVHADHAHGGGQPGELILAARTVELGAQRVPLRGFRLGQPTTGGDTTQAAMAASFALGPFAQFIHGHEIHIPIHARGTAKLAQDTVLSAAADASPAPVSAPAGGTASASPSLSPSKE